MDFTSLNSSNELLFLGTFSGSLYVYHLASLQLVREVAPNALQMRQKGDVAWKFAGRVARILAAPSSRYLLACYENKAFFLYNLARA